MFSVKSTFTNWQFVTCFHSMRENRNVILIRLKEIVTMRLSTLDERYKLQNEKKRINSCKFALQIPFFGKFRVFPFSN